MIEFRFNYLNDEGEIINGSLLVSPDRLLDIVAFLGDDVEWQEPR